MPPKTSSRSPRVRGLLTPTLKAWSSSVDLRGEVRVVGGDAGDERAVGGVHRREQLGLGVDDDDRVERAERLGVVQRPGVRRLRAPRRRDVGARCPGPSRNRAVGRASRGRAGCRRRGRASSNCSASSLALAALMSGPEVELGQRVVRVARPPAGARTAATAATGRYMSRNAGNSSRWTT